MQRSPASATNAGHRHWQAGLALARKNQWREAVRAFDRATRAAPDDALYWLNLARAQQRAGALAQAVVAARSALQLDPTDRIARRLLGDCLLQMHEHEAAAQVFAELETLGDDDIGAMMGHAAALQALHRHRDAARVLLQVLAREPALAMAHALLGDACRDQGLKREAAECMKTALALDPANLQALTRLSFEKRHLCDWQDFGAELERIREAVSASTAPRHVAVFSLLSLPLDPELQLQAARSEAAMHSRGVPLLAPVSPAQRVGRKPRLGWLSYDFREHPVAQLLVEVLEQIDRSRFDVVLYSAGPDDGSALRRRLMATATEFVDLHGLSDKLAAERIRADGIDVLVDLMGHTRGRRMAILARRPAPLQVAYLGYPGSTGADFIDYFVGDALTSPLQLAGHYSEKLAQMPLCFQPNGRGRPLPQPMTRAQAGLPEDAFVMCAFNHTYKILPEAFDSWCAVLRTLPHAVLWLKQTNTQLHGNVAREAAARGVDPSRILFARNVAYAEHFSRLALADVFVDTWPYNAHTTAADALWAGVPVVTRYGNSFASRVAASVLNAAGVPELACADQAAYEAAILALGSNAELRAAYRQHLSDNRMALPLFDTARYALDLQQLFDRMLARWRAGQACDHLPAEQGEDAA